VDLGGTFVGAGVGTGVGADVGARVGLNVGEALGLDVGPGVGGSVGNEVSRATILSFQTTSPGLSRVPPYRAILLSEFTARKYAPATPELSEVQSTLLTLPVARYTAADH
jgi:hypothetical protein